ncbi:MAG: ROK family glucokinase [Clostridiaceae bacterium]|nr:ROK family glucokinase [Clostridiaceae bacterium]
MKKYSLGVDIGGTTVKLGLFRSEGELRESWEIETRKDENGKHILDDIANSIDEVLKKRNISKDDVQGIGVGVPGPVNSNGMVFKCVNLGWDVFNVEMALERKTGLKVKAANDANIAALGELWQGGGKGYDNMVMVTLGTGVGGGVIIDGKVIAGVNGAGGEIGHIKVSDEETETCGCGKKGCLEQFASATGIVRCAKKKLNETDAPSSLRGIEELTCKDVFDKAKEGDELALGIVDSFGKTLGTVLSQIACVCDPEVFVIGGGVSKAGEIIIDSIIKHYRENAFHACKNVKFELALLGNSAGIYGGARLCQEIK